MPQDVPSNKNYSCCAVYKGYKLFKLCKPLLDFVIG